MHRPRQFSLRGLMAFITAFAIGLALMRSSSWKMDILGIIVSTSLLTALIEWLFGDKPRDGFWALYGWCLLAAVLSALVAWLSGARPDVAVITASVVFIIFFTFFKVQIP